MIYIASPYSNLRDDVMEARFKIAEACTAFWMRQGLPVFSPIVHCRQISLTYELPHDFDYWQRMNKGWIDACKQLWVLQFPNWNMSKGVCGEIKHAEDGLKNILYYSWDEIKSMGSVPSYAAVVEESILLLEEYRNESSLI